MALAPCQTAVDSSGRELVEHGTTGLPVACYHDDLGRRDVPWHWHDELEAAVVTEGCAVVSAGERKCVVRAGEGFFINSGILHGCRDADNSNCRFHSVVFHPRLVGGSLDSVIYQHYVQPLTENHALEFLRLSGEEPWQRSALEAIEESWQACRTELYGYEFRIRDALSRLVLLLQQNGPVQQAQPGVRTLRNGERIKVMLQFVHDHYSDEVTMGQIAASAAVSESECLRCFRATVDTTPIRYLRQYRIRQAARLLCHTEERISDIASRCGFQDMSYFTKSFREQLGCTPTEYRRRAECPERS